MKRLGLWGVYLIAFIAIVLVSLPKKELYYALEAQMQPYGFVFSNEHVRDSGLGFHLYDADLYYEDLKVATFERIDLMPYLLFNELSVGTFSFSEEIRKFASGTMNSIVLRQNFISPQKISIEAEGDIGDINGSIHLTDRRVVVDLNASSVLLSKQPFWFKKMKKTNGGLYRYETTY